MFAVVAANEDLDVIDIHGMFIQFQKREYQSKS